MKYIKYLIITFIILVVLSSTYVFTSTLYNSALTSNSYHLEISKNNYENAIKASNEDAILIAERNLNRELSGAKIIRSIGILTACIIILLVGFLLWVFLIY